MAMERKSSFEKRMRTIQIPEGFTGTFGSQTWEGYLGKGTSTRFFKLVKPEDTELKFDQNGGGHTRFKVGDGWLSFDRTGVEDSFYHVALFAGDTPKDLNAIVAEQLERVAKRREYYSTAVSVPGLPGDWTVAPDRVENLKAQLRDNGQLTFTPSGFGTGYMVTKEPVRGLRFGETRAKPELETFLGRSPLYVSPLDCD